MAIQLPEGGVIALDAHTDELLRRYTDEHNQWFLSLPDPDGCPCGPALITPEEMGRQLLTRLLLDWAQRRLERRS